jgi:hypothetical protein
MHFVTIQPSLISTPPLLPLNDDTLETEGDGRWTVGRPGNFGTAANGLTEMRPCFVISDIFQHREVLK